MSDFFLGSPLFLSGFLSLLFRSILMHFLVFLPKLLVAGALLVLLPPIDAQSTYQEQFDENLDLTPLPDGKLLAHFEFNTKVDASTTSGASCKFSLLRI